MDHPICDGLYLLSEQTRQRYGYMVACRPPRTPLPLPPPTAKPTTLDRFLGTTPVLPPSSPPPKKKKITTKKEEVKVGPLDRYLKKEKKSQNL